jgi:hypothetical protein
MRSAWRIDFALSGLTAECAIFSQGCALGCHISPLQAGRLNAAQGVCLLLWRRSRLSKARRSNVGLKGRDAIAQVFESRRGEPQAG